MSVRRLGPGDESVVERLATKEKPARAHDLLADDRTLFFVAFDDDHPIGFVFAYEMLRRHGDPSMIFVYDVDVDEPYRRRGVATSLFLELGRVAKERGIREGFVLTERENEPAMKLYESVGGVLPQNCVMWEFRYAES
jgi:ribosomal protein S18 acetylase RimI-like enzyme